MIWKVLQLNRCNTSDPASNFETLGADSMNDANDHIQMALKSIEGFANNGKLDADELQEIIDIAERDGVIDQDEIRVFRSIISRIDPSEVDDAMRQKLTEILTKVAKP